MNKTARGKKKIRSTRKIYRFHLQFARECAEAVPEITFSAPEGPETLNSEKPFQITDTRTHACINAFPLSLCLVASGV